MKLIDREQITGMNCHYYNYSFEYFLDSMQRNGYESVALWAGAPHFFLDYMGYSDCKRIRRKISERNLKIKCFTPSSGTYGYQMCMQPKEQNARCLKYYLNGIKATAELGCTMMSMNSGWGYWNENFEDAWKRAEDMIFKLCLAAEKEGIILTMESLRRAESQLCWNLALTKKMFEEIGHPALKIMIDTTAMAVAGETIEEWFEEFGSAVVNTHFVDGTPYGHLAWGDGEQNLEHWLKTLKKYSYSGPLGLEITHRRYYQSPEEADRKSMAALETFTFN